MFTRGRPSDPEIARFVARLAHSHLSYDTIGLSELSPPGYNVDEQRARVGSGMEAFERAKAALDDWAGFRLSWIEVHPRNASTREGANVAVLARHCGVWSLNGCRVVRRIGGSAELVHGFAYGTLQEHVESGEESFVIRFDPEDQSVWYEIRAVSRPRALAARAGYPLSRWFQRRFREDSARALRRAISA